MIKGKRRMIQMLVRKSDTFHQLVQQIEAESVFRFMTKEKLTKEFDYATITALGHAPTCVAQFLDDVDFPIPFGEPIQKHVALGSHIQSILLDSGKAT
jgi:hypothetical protein